MTLCLTACGTETSQSPSAPSNLPVTQWRVTGDIPLPSPAIQMTFVANSVAPWVGQIIYIDELGEIWRSYATNPVPTAVDTGTFIDVYGLYREQAAGMFLAIDKSGSLKAFVEMDDEGNFKTIITSENTEMSARQFCRGGNPFTSKAWLINTDGDLIDYLIADISEDAITLEYGDVAASEISNCYVNKNGQVAFSTTNSAKYQNLGDQTQTNLPAYVTNPTDLSTQDTNLVIGQVSDPKLSVAFNGSTVNTISVLDGLSVSGTDTAPLITGTNLSFGSVYSDGIVVLSDMDSDRLVTISASYIKSLDQ